MSIVWNNYYDRIKYSKKSETLDRSGKVVYESPIILNARLVDGGRDFVINKDSVAVKYTKEYQIPQMIQEDDMIDDRLVISVERVCDVFGQFQFCIARVK